MVKIKEIRIRNFRSIVDITIIPKELNVFVGLNDSGKSNILKALNLFFNNQTDENCDFDFGIDYSKLTPKKVKKALEIVIQIKLEIPDNYKDGGEYIWKKVWRSTSTIPYVDSLEDDIKNRKFSVYSKAPVLLKRIIYTYVPATKSNEYFMRLLGNLYTSDLT